MKLRYYLRGLGIGMLVAALVLVLSGKTNGQMSDEAVKRRAGELGMVEKDKTVLDKLGSEEAQAAAPDNASKQEGVATPDNAPKQEGVVTPDNASKQEVATPDNASKKEVVTPNNASKQEGVVTPDNASKKEEAATNQNTNQNTSKQEEVTKPENTPQKTETDTAGASNAGTNNTGQNLANAGAEQQIPKPAQSTEQGQIEQRAEEIAAKGKEVAENAPAGRVVTFVVERGDSSTSVARKAKEMGLVISAADFDVFLCQNGYDRRICTGSYEIVEGASAKEIADKITKSN